jgi:hypothetical protein
MRTFIEHAKQFFHCCEFVDHGEFVDRLAFEDIAIRQILIYFRPECDRFALPNRSGPGAD